VDAREFTEKVISSLGVPHKVLFGHSKLFSQDTFATHMEGLVMARLSRCATTIQKIWKGRLCRRRFQRTKWLVERKRERAREREREREREQERERERERGERKIKREREKVSE
jgi:myosin heavy subunit